MVQMVSPFIWGVFLTLDRERLNFILQKLHFLTFLSFCLRISHFVILCFLRNKFDDLITALINKTIQLKLYHLKSSKIWNPKLNFLLFRCLFLRIFLKDITFFLLFILFSIMQYQTVYYFLQFPWVFPKWEQNTF